ncbi:MAG TPA: type II secretion system F family protein [Dehalococcoidales bacterium]|nr:type II secretion system F family protein [Dehalococcoidales bacterium]
MFDKLKKMLPFLGNKKSHSKGPMSFDMFYQLSYMSTIAAAGVPRDQIFAHAAELKCSSAEYFKRVELAKERLKYDYARACRTVGEPAKEIEIKGLLLRLSSSLISGEPEAEFLSREAHARAEDYENEYTRALEALKMWTDAYVSLILSAVLVVVIGIVSTMIWKINTTLILGMAFISVTSTCIGIWLIWVVSPKETMTLHWPGSKEQKLASKLFKPVLAVSVIIAALFLLAGKNLGMALIIIAALVLPTGYIMSTDDKKIHHRDDEVGTFLRSLGGVCSALGTTVNSSLSRIDLDAINILRSSVKNLHTRLTAGIKPKLSWSKFIDETGSELANRSVGMFYDAIEVGGSAGQAGQHAAAFANRVAGLRAKRRTIAGPFRWLCIVMHAAVVIILVFITEIIVAFGGMVDTAQNAMPSVSGAPTLSSFSSFNLSGLQLMHHMVLPLVLVFTVANAIVPVVAEGGSKIKILSNLGITSLISGTALIILPILATTLFASVAKF